MSVIDILFLTLFLYNIYFFIWWNFCEIHKIYSLRLKIIVI